MSGDQRAPRIHAPLRYTARGAAFGLTIALSISIPSGLHGQAVGVTRAAIIQAEDERGKGQQGIEPILAGLKTPSLRALSIRAIGRLERPDLLSHIIPYVGDTSVQATVADAIAQVMRGRLPRQQGPDTQLVALVYNVLRSQSQTVIDGPSRGAFARSLGRLPYATPAQARSADSLLVTLAPLRVEDRSAYVAFEGVAHGLYALARSRRTLGALSPAAVEWLQKAVQFGLDVPEAVAIRRAAWLALTANGTVDRGLIRVATSDEIDPQVRRLAVAALPNERDWAVHREELARVARDRDPIVRLERVRVYRQLVAADGCGPLLDALSDTVHHVRLAAIDALGGPCPERDSVVVMLLRAIENGPSGVTARSSRGVSWHERAHALAALARADSSVAREYLRRDSKHPVWQVRMYAARGAAAIRDSVILSSLAFDEVGNVREVAIQGLSSTIGHLADLVYVRALRSKDYHVVLAAARALKGAPVLDSVRPAVFEALERLSNEKRQNSRDPRMELLARAREMADRVDVPRLQQLLGDVDEAIAAEAASVMNQVLNTSQYVVAPRRPVRFVAPPSGAIRVRVTMSARTGGGSFDVLLDADRAPMTVARVLELVRKRYYDGLTFHRVVPNFVLQGGSPGMNEYVGDGPFMRDELSLEHHARYTLGISTRGRDTGDAQWFINLVDNYRLDHDYTVFGRVVAGMEVVDRILEGDVMESVRIVPN